MKQKKFYLYHIDMKYVRDLHKVDDKVSSVSPQIGKEKRAYVGIVVLCNNQQYCIPLSHPQKKHHNMKPSIDFEKIYNNDKLIAVLNYNLMIPVNSNQLIPIDFRKNKNDKEKDKYYKRLCNNELMWCRKNQEKIINKANVLYNKYLSDEYFSARGRCVDFTKLEKVCKKYNEKSKFPP